MHGCLEIVKGQKDPSGFEGNEGYGSEDFFRTVRKASFAFSWIFLMGSMEPIDNFSFDESQFL